jgi:hypothetical protein
LIERRELFDLFNQVNFSDPNVTLTDVVFGKITKPGMPGVLQFGLKLYQSPIS